MLCKQAKCVVSCLIFQVNAEYYTVRKMVHSCLQIVRGDSLLEALSDSYFAAATICLTDLSQNEPYFNFCKPPDKLKLMKWTCSSSVLRYLAN